MTQPSPAPDELFEPSEDELDDLPLTFGQFKGKTPNEVAALGLKPRSYLVWMYETVANKPTLSRRLYAACGGTRGNYQEIKAQEELKRQMQLQASRAKNHGFDSYEDADDDCPF